MKQKPSCSPKQRALLVIAILLLSAAACILAFNRPYLKYYIAFRKEYSYSKSSKYDYIRDGDTYFAPMMTKEGKAYIPCESSEDWIVLGEQDIRNGEDTEIARFAAAYHFMLPIFETRKKSALAYGHEYFCSDRYAGSEKQAVKTQLITALLF